jgi:two-component system KDP operon response regulator KdpE
MHSVNIVLVIGERPEQADALAQRLGILGVEAIPSARDWKLAVRCLTSHRVDLILLDVEDSDASRDFYELIRDLATVPVLARGSYASAEQVVWYLDHGAADYISRTVPTSVLVAKVTSLLRSPALAKPSAGALRVGELTIDLDRYVVTKGARQISLTPLEFRLLRVLAENRGKACSHKALLERVWGEDFQDCSHYLRLYIGYLRQKVEDNPRRPNLLLTEWGYGYRLVEPEPQETSVRRRSLRMASSG